jgi:cellulose synthase/poly-beta-1,6-N-acetylglucosamine synthase-like glycosyltransferase
MASILICLLLLSVAQRIVFALGSLSKRRRPFTTEELPAVQVLVAAHNEEASLPRFLEALDHLDYDPARLSFVLVSDGSTDATVALMEDWCLRRDRAVVIATAHHSGKAAALQTAWENAPGAELTVLYDADVRPNAMRLMAREFSDPSVGAVTGPVLPSNFGANMVARYASLELWVFHQVIQAARDRLGLNPPAVGANSAYRSAALRDIGGFPRHPTCAEDIETCFAIQRRAWRTRFCADACVATEVPQTTAEFWAQRKRWTRGLYQAIWRAPSLSAAFIAMGYADRLIFLAVTGAAALGFVSWGWPPVYFLGPALNVWLALARVRVPSKIRSLCGAVPMFGVDLGVTFYGMLMSLGSLRFRPASRWTRASSRRAT